MSDLVSKCCGAEIDPAPNFPLCKNCGMICKVVGETEWLHQKIDSLQMELRDVKAKVATLEGEMSTTQKFIKSQGQ